MTNPTEALIRDAERDSRPEIEPDCFSFRDLPEDKNDMRAAMQEIGESWRGLVEWGRYTIVSDEHPLAPYPNGLYFEGWTKAPHHYDPPGKEPPFSYPLVATGTTAHDE